MYLRSLFSIIYILFDVLLCVFQDGDTPLHVACRKRHVSLAELLLGKFNANINIRNKVCKFSRVYHQRNDEFSILLRVPKIG